jgi:hypothetical protein
VDWYPHFGANSAIIRALEIAFCVSVTFVENVQFADIILIGPYGNKHKHPEIVRISKPWKLFCTAENVLPDYRYYHHSLTFSRFDFNKRNYRWPCWHHSLALDKHGEYTYTHDQTQYLLNVNRPLINPHEKEKWSQCVAIFNNMEPIRCHLYAKFSHYGIIDGIGGPFGNGFSWGDETTYRQKLSALSPYGFNLCLENTISDGYYTEKVLHARSSGCIAIVYSDPHIYDDFHPDGIINLYDYESVNALVEDVLSLTSDKDALVSKANSPIFTTTPDVYGVVAFIREAYKLYAEGYLDAAPVQFSDSTPEVPTPSLMKKMLQRLLVFTK